MCVSPHGPLSLASLGLLAPCEVPTMAAKLVSGSRLASLRLPMRWGGHGGPAMGPTRAPGPAWTEARCVARCGCVFGPPTGLPLSARRTLILASACVRPGLASWGVRLSLWARAHRPLPSPAAKPAPGPTPPCRPLSLRGPESADLETEAPCLLPRPLSFLPLSPPSRSLAPSLSLLLPNASWLRLNISPPRFLAPALGAFTKRRASSPLPRPPSLLLPPPLEEPL